MKKFFEKYDLIKLAGIMVLISVILTWLIPYGYFSGTEMVTDEIKRIGITNFFQYGLLGIYYFTVLVTFLFVMGGFYQVLAKRAGYQKLIKNISRILKGKEIIVVLVTSFIFAVAGSLVTEYFPLIALIPFVIAILNKLKVDKISSFVATFGGLLVGAIGSTYSPKVAGALTNTFAIESKDILLCQIILFVVSFILLGLFTVLRMKKLKKPKNFEAYDKFEEEYTEEVKNAKSWPYIIGIVLFVLVTLLAYLPWGTWEIELWDNVTKWVQELSIAEIPIVSYIFGDIAAFGSWDIFQLQFVMLAVTVLMLIFGKTSFSEVCESYGEGFKKMSYTVIVMLLVYAVVEFSVMFPVIPVIVDWINGLTSGFNSLLTYLSAIITSAFSGEMQYAMNLAGTYYAATVDTSASVLAMIFQSAFGLVSFIAPSSVILMIGLAYLGIPYKDWMKFIWKFLVAMLAVSLIIILFIA